MLDSDGIRDLRSEGVKDRTFFEKPKAKIVPSTVIVVDPDVEGGTFTLSM
jgi:hypothetical protein